MRTESELIRDGIIKMENNQYKNAVVECYVHGGAKGLWINGVYYRAIRKGMDIGYDVP